MPDAPVTPAAPAAPAATEPSTAVTTPPVAPAAPTEPPKADPPAVAPTGNPWDDPKAAEAEIKKLRQEAGAARVNAKQAAADEARKEFAQSIGKVLGLVDDDANDPAKLTASLTTSQAEAKQARVELAVFRNATTAGGDPAALLDSSSFLKSLADVDPNDAAAVTAAITSAVAANPRLGAAPGTPQTPAPNPAQGSSGQGSPGFDQQIAEATKNGDHALAVRLKRQSFAAKAT